MKTLKFLLPFVLVAMLIVSCEKEADTIAPVIEVSGPEANEILYVGSTIHFEADFSDDVALKSYKIDIHSNFDGHTHKSESTDSSEWHFQQSWSFDEGAKNAHIHHHEIEVPEEIDGLPIEPGDYHFMIYCTDAAGNESWTAIAVEIQYPTDSIAPAITNISAPAQGSAFSTNDVISITGEISDDNELHGIFVAIMKEGSTTEQVNETDAFAVMLHEHDAVEGLTEYSFSASITVGQVQDNNNPSNEVTWTPGNYFIIVKTVDASGNVAFSAEYPIVIQ